MCREDIAVCTPCGIGGPRGRRDDSAMVQCDGVKVWNPEARRLPYVQAFVCHAFARRWVRHSHSPRAPWPCRCQHNDDLHARPQSRCIGSAKSCRSSVIGRNAWRLCASVAHNAEGPGCGVPLHRCRSKCLDANRRRFFGPVGCEGSHITATLAANRSADRGGTAMLGSARSMVYGRPLRLSKAAVGCELDEPST